MFEKEYELTKNENLERNFLDILKAFFYMFGLLIPLFFYWIFIWNISWFLEWFIIILFVFIITILSARQKWIKQKFFINEKCLKLYLPLNIWYIQLNRTSLKSFKENKSCYILSFQEKKVYLHKRVFLWREKDILLHLIKNDKHKI